MDVAMLRGPVLLKVVEQAVFYIPPQVHDTPDRFRLHLVLRKRRDDERILRFLSNPLAVAIVFSYLTHFETTQRFVDTVPTREILPVPNLHLIACTRCLGPLLGRPRCCVLHADVRWTLVEQTSRIFDDMEFLLGTNNYVFVTSTHLIDEGTARIQRVGTHHIAPRPAELLITFFYES